jgi:hypothetical protein
MSKERYEIATFFEATPGGGGIPHVHHKLTIDNYGKGKYLQNHMDTTHVVDPGKPFTDPLPESLIKFVQAVNTSVGSKNSFTYYGQVDVNYQFIKDLHLLQDVAKEMNMYKHKMEEEIQKRVKAKEAELEEEFQRRVQVYKEDFQAELELARNIIENAKKPVPKAEEYAKKHMNKPVSQEKWEKESHFEHAQEVWVSKTGDIFETHRFDTQEQLVDAWRNNNKQIRHKEKGVWRSNVV